MREISRKGVGKETEEGNVLFRALGDTATVGLPNKSRKEFKIKGCIGDPNQEVNSSV